LDQGFDDPHYWNLLLENNNKILREDIKMKNGHILKFATEYQKLIKPNVQHIKKIEINKIKKTVRVPCLKEAECLQLKAGDFIEYFTTQVKGGYFRSVVVDNFLERNILWVHEIGLRKSDIETFSYIFYKILSGRVLLMKVGSIEKEMEKHLLSLDNALAFQVNDEITVKQRTIGCWCLCKIIEKMKIKYMFLIRLLDSRNGSKSTMLVRKNLLRNLLLLILMIKIECFLPLYCTIHNCKFFE